MKKLDAIILAAALLLSAILLGWAVRTQAVETAGWGLSFPQEGQPPMGPVSPEKLRKFDAYYLGDPGEKTVYLTFDAGYENGCTARILDALKRHHAPAAFFLVGNYLEKNADLVRRMVSDGHTVGNHTVHHRDMSGQTDAEFEKELTGLEEQFEAITGAVLPKFYRPPMGIYSEENLKAAQRLGYRTIFWSLAYADWDNDRQPQPQAAIEKLCRRIHPGAIVLLHATSQTNAEILDALLTRWEQMGYRFAPLSELDGPKPTI